jgi:Tfp pilus assembly protein PilX
MRDQRGIVLPLTLMVTLALTSLGIALLAFTGMEPAISRNLADATRARFAAEAGVEWTFNILATTANWSALLAGADPTQGVTLVANSPLPGQPASNGVFTVRLRNDTLDGDPQITGAALDTGGPTTDTNGRVIVTSTGTFADATRTLRVMIRRPVFPPFPGALSFPGNEAETRFNGSSFEVNGNDFNTDGTPGSCAAVFGISVSSVLPTSNPGGNEAVVENSLAANQKQDVKGKRQDPSGNPWGNNTIAPNPDLAPAVISDFINQFKQNADIILQSHQPGGLTFNNIGSTCATDWNSQTCWGTTERPKVIWIKGDPDPTSMFTALYLGGNTEGHGVLIVEDGDLRIYGNFLWHGPIIVTGQWVGIGYLGGGEQIVYGAVISNETATDPRFYEGVMVGNSKIRYSCQALNQARTARRLTTIASWQEVSQ